MSMYFGTAWNSNVKNSHEKAITPIGESCSWCDEKIVECDRGFIIPEVVANNQVLFKPVHLDCFLRQIFGSVGHQNKLCSCYNGNQEDPPHMTTRQAATEAVKLYYERFKHVV